MITALASIQLEVTDPQRSKRWYIDALGLNENERRSHAPDFVYLESAGAAITLTRSPDGAPSSTRQTFELGFEVKNIDEVLAHFAYIGVTDFQRQSMGWADAIEIHDADGYRVIVYCFTRM